MNLKQRDKQSLWHPYTQHQTAVDPLPIINGNGAYLIDEQAKHYLDMTSSWWVNLHGHSHPAIAKAIYEQALQLEHVIFANFTHEPAIQLAEQILAVTPSNLTKLFYSDNGSTAVEVALKMTYQYWRNRDETKRQRFIAFNGGYHGDTFGSMSLSKKCGFFTAFEPLFFPVETFNYPATWINDHNVLAKEAHCLAELEEYLEQYGAETAAIIIEPLIQGVSGMSMCREKFLQHLEDIVRQYGVLIIYDEVMTGFGRTGELFACLKAQTKPDIICVAKGITGGFLPLAATLCSDAIYNEFLGDGFDRALAHGHSYAANPLGCAAGLASLKLLLEDTTQLQLQTIAEVHAEQLPQLLQHCETKIENIRQCGTIAAFDLKTNIQYGSPISQKLQHDCQERGLLIRPLGKTVYLLPPYCVSADELIGTYNILSNLLAL